MRGGIEDKINHTEISGYILPNKTPHIPPIKYNIFKISNIL